MMNRQATLDLYAVPANAVCAAAWGWWGFVHHHVVS